MTEAADETDGSGDVSSGHGECREGRMASADEDSSCLYRKDELEHVEPMAAGVDVLMQGWMAIVYTGKARKVGVPSYMHIAYCVTW